jgi:predicted nucleic acid-binding protein
MTLPVFVDTGGWFALYIAAGPDHAAACRWMAGHRGPLLTTDYVIDETLTLMRARGQPEIALDFGADVFAGKLAAVHYLTPAEIAQAWDVFHRYTDKAWSFTDCTSKVVIETLGLAEAFSFDHHFRQFGTVAVVP